MTLLSKMFFSIALSLATTAALSAQTQLNITLKNNSAGEIQTRMRLEKLLQRYKLSKWLFTRQVIIEDYAVPHSDPVLTLNTRGDEYALLSKFIHEEIHWFLDAHPKRTARTIKILRNEYRKVPVGDPEGADNEESSYLHLIVNLLEYEAMKELVGNAKAREVFEAKDYYKSIYQTVLTDENKILRVLKKNKLKI